jgi:uncharacterized integral membrane protein
VNEQKQGTNWRAWAIGVLIALVAIVALQNTQEVEVEVLFVETRAPLIATLLIAIGVGAVIGYVAPLVLRHRRQVRERHEA